MLFKNYVFLLLLFIALPLRLHAMNNSSFNEHNDDEDDGLPFSWCPATCGTSLVAGWGTTKYFMSQLPSDTVFPITMGVIMSVGVFLTCNELYYVHRDLQHRKHKEKVD